MHIEYRNGNIFICAINKAELHHCFHLRVDDKGDYFWRCLVACSRCSHGAASLTSIGSLYLLIGAKL